MTQIMWMDNLAPDIQEEILFLPNTVKGRDRIKEADIRPVAKTLNWTQQRKMWQAIKDSQPVNPRQTGTVWFGGSEANGVVTSSHFVNRERDSSQRENR
jgi:hypothetical protein